MKGKQKNWVGGGRFCVCPTNLTRLVNSKVTVEGDGAEIRKLNDESLMIFFQYLSVVEPFLDEQEKNINQ